VKNLELKWILPNQVFGAWQSTPLVVDGIMYVTQRPNDVLAVDAKTGRVFWMYRHTPSPEARVCCGSNNRGVAILGDTVYLGTLDARLVAIDAKTGKPLWNVPVGDPKLGYSITMAPLIVKDKVLVGTGGGEYGIRGFVAAYDAQTGKEVWRFHTIPAPGEPGGDTWKGEAWKTGGGSIWLTPSYDPELNLTYWGVGNPGPDWNPDQRPGDNLYTDSVIAVDADTGKLKWHYQFTPNDEFDWDSVQVPVLANIDWQGRPRKVMLWANRNGFVYVLDRVTGEFLLGKAFVKQNWNLGFDNGRPVRDPKAKPTPEGTRIEPGTQGGTNWYSPSFSPRTGLFYVSAWDNYSAIARFAEVPPWAEGKKYTGRAPPARGVTGGGRAGVAFRTEAEGYGAVRAIDPKTGEKKWDFKMVDYTESGVLTTASDLLFSGGREGHFFALDARSGDLLWKANLGGNVANGPISFGVEGRQYVAVSGEGALYVFGLPE
jgi:alcohol dehydrogenase (cytochrome c)